MSEEKDLQEIEKDLKEIIRPTLQKQGKQLEDLIAIMLGEPSSSVASEGEVENDQVNPTKVDPPMRG